MRLPSRDLEQSARRLSAEGGDSLRGRSVVVTGGSGFIGRWLIETFCERNRLSTDDAEIAVLTRDVNAFRARAPHIAEDPAVTLIEGDLRALGNGTAAGVPPRCDYVIHAATDSADNLAKQPATFVETIEGTRDALEFAVRAGATRFLFVSSGAVYGRQPAAISHLEEEFSGAPDVFQPHSAYGEAKRAGELLCSMYRRCDLEVSIARLFSVIGPLIPLDQKFAAGSLLGDALSGRRIEIRGDGTPLRSYLYAADVAVWLWVVLLQGVSGRAYNVGSEAAVSIAELAGEAARLQDPPLPVMLLGRPDSAKQPERYLPSTERARLELGLSETVGWRAALRKTYEWYRQLPLAEFSTGRV